MDPAIRGGPPTAALRAESSREESCARILVVPDQRLAAQPPHLLRLEEQIGAVCRAARPPASRAVTVHETLGRALDLESDPAAQTASLDPSRLRRNRRPLNAGHARPGLKLLVLRDRIGDLVPRGLGASEDMRLRLDAQVAIQIARGARYEAHLR